MSSGIIPLLIFYLPRRYIF